MLDTDRYVVVFPDCPPLRAGDTLHVITTHTYPATGVPPIPHIVSASVVTAHGGEYPVRVEVRRVKEGSDH
jgi:hypothetical protein